MERSKPQSAIEYMGMLARGGNRILSFAINLFAIVIFLYGLYATVDTWAVFKGAGTDASLLVYKPELHGKEEENPTVKELMALYPDTRAWLTLDDTNIDYPVFQSEDNTYYVNKDMTGTFSLSGEIFLYCRNEADFSDMYSILYGHHMEMNAMFGGLDLFKEQTYLENHTTGLLFLPEESLEIEIFACVATDAYDPVLFNPYLQTEEDRQVLLDAIQENYFSYREIQWDEGDTIIAFATCSSSGTNARTIVFGRLQ